MKSLGENNWRIRTILLFFYFCFFSGYNHYIYLGENVYTLLFEIFYLQ